MPAALTPDLAISYVRELSADVRAVVVLDADGRRLAGPEPVAAPARAYLHASPGRPDCATRVPGGLVVKAATTSHAVVVAAGPLSLVGPTALDARTAVEALASAEPPRATLTAACAPEAGGEAVRAAAEAVLLAARSAI